MPSSSNQPDDAALPDEKKVGFLQVLKNRNVLVLFVAMLLLNVLLYGILSWIPTYIRTTFGLSISQAGWILSANAVLQTVASIFSGSLLSKLFLHREKQAVLGSTLIAGVLMIVFTASHSLVLSLICLIIISCLSMLAFTGIFTWPHKVMDAHVIGSSIGVINTGGTLGGFIAPYVIGQLIKISGGSFVGAFAFMGIAGILSGLMVLLVKVGKKPSTQQLAQ